MALFIVLLTLGGFYSNADLLAETSEPLTSSIEYEVEDDFITIDFLRESDLAYKRMIEVYNHRGKRIFKSWAYPNEKISELNMRQLKAGQYLVRIILRDGYSELNYVKTET